MLARFLPARQSCRQRGGRRQPIHRGLSVSSYADRMRADRASPERKLWDPPDSVLLKVKQCAYCTNTKMKQKSGKFRPTRLAEKVRKIGAKKEIFRCRGPWPTLPPWPPPLSPSSSLRPARGGGGCVTVFGRAPRRVMVMLTLSNICRTSLG